jgi:tetratricopeptide (TPR) repeat protein
LWNVVYGRLSGMTLDDELDRIFAARDRDNMQPTIDALLPLYASHPENARVLYEVGGAYDTAGQEETARGFYESSLAAGLEGDLLRRCYVQYGSTLRNVGEYEKSREVFATARNIFPESPALGAFEAITLHAAGQPDAAVAALLDLLVDFVRTPDIDRYKPAISGNAEYIRSLERHDPDLSSQSH